MNWKKVAKTVFNKYLICTLGIGTCLIFFDRNDMFTQYGLYNQVQKLKNERDYYKKEIDDNNKMISDLQTNPAVIEKYAREYHKFKKPNEEIFIFSNK